MIIDKSNVLEVINKSGLDPKKDLGQNFLCEPKLCEDIVNTLDINSYDKVLEIGPGLGSLTHFLVSKTPQIDVVDIDERMTNFLKVIYQKTNVNIITNDIKKHDVSDYTKIIGNLPYYITSEIITYLLLNAKNCQKMVLMVQQETYPHFSDISGKEYGPIAVLINLIGNIKRTLVVKKGSFHPMPKCQSVVFEINITNHIIDRKALLKMIKALFLLRRKTIYNNLMNLLKDKSKVELVLGKTNIDPNTRPEQIPPIKYLELFNVVNNLH